MMAPPDNNEHSTHVREDNTTHEGSSSGKFVDVIQMMARELANVLSQAEQSRNKVQLNENRAMVALEKFKKLSLPTFNGMSGPDGAKSWLDF